MRRTGTGGSTGGRGSLRAASAGLVLLAVGLLAAPSALADEERTFAKEPGIAFSEVVAVVEGTQCIQDAAEPSGTIEWGDGLSSPAETFKKTGPGTWEVSGRHTYSKAGVYKGRFTGTYECSGDGASFAASKFTAEVFGNERLKAQAGVQFSGVVAPTRASECQLPIPTGTIEWGDGQSSAAEFSATGGGNLLVSGKHTYSKAGSYRGHFSGEYECEGAKGLSFELRPEGFSFEVTGSETTATTTTPSAPPQAHAAFAIQSVVPGRAVLEAAASSPPGASVSSYSWNITGASQPDVVCQGSEPTLTVQTEAAMNTTVSLTATDAASGERTVVSQQLEIPAPTKPALIGKLARAGSLSAQRVAPAGAVTPSFKLIGTCTGAGLPYSPEASFKAVSGIKSAFSTFGGVPSAECLEETEFGAADVEGCLGTVEKLEEIPGGITAGLSKLLCGTRLEQFCTPALSALSGTVVNAVLGRVAAARPGAHAAVNIPFAEGKLDTALADTRFPFYFATGAVRIDGLDLDPQPGSPLVIVPSADLVFGLNVKVYLHDVPLVQLPALILHLPDLGGTMGELKLPKSVPIIGSLPFTGSIGISLHKAGTKLSNGDTCAFDCAAMAVNLELPGIFTGANGEGLHAAAVITADDQDGLELSSFEVKVPEADLGGIGVKEVEFIYLHANDSLHGAATVDLGPVGDIGGSVDFIHGHFNGATLNYSHGDGPGIDLGGPLNIYLTELGGGFTVEPPVIEAHGEITGGPDALGCSLLAINAELEMRFQPEFALDANGTGSLLCQSVASEYFHIDGGGHIGLGAHVHIHFLVFAVEGGFDFDAEPEHGHFQADANVSACLDLYGEHCLTAEAVISDRGIGVCADLGFTHAGGGIQFPDNPIIFFDSCDIGKFRSLGFVTGVNGRRATSQAFTVAKGQNVALIGLPGSGGPPRATLTGPSGRTIRTPSSCYEKTPDYVVICDNRSTTQETYFFINHPEPGAWKVSPEPGSPAITSIQQAGSLPAPAVKGHVSPLRGGRERLTYSVNPIPGQQVVFAERQADGGFHEIGAATGRHGTLLFTPSPNLGRSRTIEAMVSQDGHPREDAVITHFGFLPRALPAPGGLRLLRRGGALEISFRPVAGAAGYSLGVRLSDGRSLYLKLPASAHRARIAAVPSNLSGAVTLAALMPGIRLKDGHVSKARLKAGAQPGRTVVLPLRS